jgi:hypothetical protein
MSIYSLDTLSKEGAVRLSVEVFAVFGVVTLGYLFVIEPALQSFAPRVYTEVGLDYSWRDWPDTASEATHLFLALVVGVTHLFWRLNCTELGATFKHAVMEDHGKER